MDGLLPSPEERRRIARLAIAVPAERWIVAPEDPGAEVACCAAAASTAPVLAVAPAVALGALRLVTAAGLRQRVRLRSGGPTTPAGWEAPIGLLILPAASPALRALLAAWAGHVSPHGWIAFYGGTVPGPRLLGLRPAFWSAEGGSPLVLTRRPFGCAHCY